MQIDFITHKKELCGYNPNVNFFTMDNYNDKVVSKNETFKKWLSNQQIIQSNLQRIFNKASEFERKFQLTSQRNSNLSTLVTTYFYEDNEQKVLQQEVSFAFIRGFNDYAKFKKENPYQGDDDETKKTSY